MSFIRVRSAVAGGPLHEFDIPIVTYQRHPDRYKVIDKKLVSRQRPASHIPGVVKASKPHNAAVKTGEDKNAPSAGPTPKEENNGS